MNRSHRSRTVCSLCWLAVLIAQDAVSAQAACYNSPTAAVDSLRPGSLTAPVSSGGGYRVTTIQSDPLLGQRWVMIASCDHPERPVIAFQDQGSSVLQQIAQEHDVNSHEIPVVRIGDIVLLWKQEDLLRIEVAGVAEENGGLSKTIRVRLLHRNTDNQSSQEEFAGIVRGPSDVEMQP
jgi:hypothetical protein